MHQGIRDPLPKNFEKNLFVVPTFRMAAIDRVRHLVFQPLKSLPWGQNSRAIKVTGLLSPIIEVNRPEQACLGHVGMGFSPEKNKAEPGRGEDPLLFAENASGLHVSLESHRIDWVADARHLSIFLESNVIEVLHSCGCWRRFKFREVDWFIFLFGFCRTALGLKQKLSIGLDDLLLEVSVEYVDRNTVVLQVLDPLPVHGRVGILNTDPDFLDSGGNDSF